MRLGSVLFVALLVCACSVVRSDSERSAADKPFDVAEFDYSDVVDSGGFDEINEDLFDDKPFQEFVAWLEEKGGTEITADIKFIRSKFGGYGVVNLNDLQPGDPVFRVPEELWMTVHNAAEDPIFGKVMTESPWLLPHEYDPKVQGGRFQTLGVFLLYEKFKGPDSHWGPYINILPKHFDLPIYWNPKELAQLNGTMVLPSAASDSEWLKKFYDYVFTDGLCVYHPNIFDCDEYTFFEYKWAYGISVSRPFGMSNEWDLARDPGGVLSWLRWLAGEPPAKAPGYSTLVPLADMLNHGNPSNVNYRTTYLIDTVHVDRPGSHLLVKGKVPRRFHTMASNPQDPIVPAGTELFDSYGPRSNQELISTYGFCLPNNNRNQLLVKFPEVDHDDPDVKVQVSYLTALGLIRPEIYRMFEGGDVPDMMPAARILSANATILETWADRFLSSNITLGVLPFNELAAFEFLDKVLSDQMDTFHGSIEEDYEILEKLDSGSLGKQREHRRFTSVDEAGESQEGSSALKTSKLRPWATLTPADVYPVKPEPNPLPDVPKRGGAKPEWYHDPANITAPARETFLRHGDPDPYSNSLIEGVSNSRLRAAVVLRLGSRKILQAMRDHTKARKDAFVNRVKTWVEANPLPADADYEFNMETFENIPIVAMAPLPSEVKAAQDKHKELTEGDAEAEEPEAINIEAGSAAAPSKDEL